MAAAPLPDNERCQRCGQPFHCGAADPQGCACAGLSLAPALLVQLREAYARCLCLDCLRQLQAGAPLHAPAGKP